MKVLGIESSCDETGVAIYDSQTHQVFDNVFSQIDLHQVYGGVVPELASRDHLKRLNPLLQQTLKDSNTKLEEIDLIAYTATPGLVGALLTGAMFAKSLAFVLKKPSLAVHHMEGHLLTPLLTSDIKFPFVALLISGGHTQLILAKNLGDYQLLGQTLDDAVGEAFDKTAKMLNLPYPGGPYIEKLAKQGKAVVNLPKPMLHKGLDFSFSGLKTAVLLQWKESDKSEEFKANLCASFESVVAQLLAFKCKKALKDNSINQLVVAGGVSSNAVIRATLQSEIDNVYFPDKKYCTDNGAMIAFAGFMNAKKANFDKEVLVKARISLEDWVLLNNQD